MANIYVHELDQWIETLRKDFDCGKSRASNREHVATASAISRRKRKLKKLTVGTQDYECTKKEIADAYQRLWSMPSQDQMDPSYKRLRYCRYADDSLLGIIGAKDDARQILRQVEGFLQEVLKLELSQDKTKITNSKDFITFLGYDIHTFKSDRVRKVQNPHGKIN